MTLHLSEEPESRPKPWPPDGRDEGGKVQYATILEFDSREVGARVEAGALKAVEDFAFKTDFSGERAP